MSLSLHLPHLLANLCSWGSVRDETRSGGVHFNDVIQHLGVDHMPFSGIGESGCKWLVYNPPRRARLDHDVV